MQKNPTWTFTLATVAVFTLSPIAARADSCAPAGASGDEGKRRMNVLLESRHIFADNHPGEPGLIFFFDSGEGTRLPEHEFVALPKDGTSLAIPQSVVDKASPGQKIWVYNNTGNDAFFFPHDQAAMKTKFKEAIDCPQAKKENHFAESSGSTPQCSIVSLDGLSGGTLLHGILGAHCDTLARTAEKTRLNTTDYADLEQVQNSFAKTLNRSPAIEGYRVQTISNKKSKDGNGIGETQTGGKDKFRQGTGKTMEKSH